MPLSNLSSVETMKKIAVILIALTLTASAQTKNDLENERNFFKGSMICRICVQLNKMIEKNAHLAGFGVVYLLVILVSYLPVVMAPEAKIPTQWFPYLFPIAVICQYFTQSLATLIQYGRGSKGEQL